MKINIENLIVELCGYTKSSNTLDNMSFESRKILGAMHQQFETLQESNESDKQKKMITLFIGATICALISVDSKYGFKTPFYPALGVALSKVPVGSDFTTDVLYTVGNTVLPYLSETPTLFNGDLFKREADWDRRGVNDKSLLPVLKQHSERVDLLTKFCMKHSNDLECPEVETDDLVLVDCSTNTLTPEALEATLSPRTEITAIKSDEPTKAPTASTSSNVGMQVLAGFISVLGIAAVVIAFVCLNAASFGLAGVITGGLGVCLLLAGVGLFAMKAGNSQSPVDPSLNLVAPSI